MFHAATETDGLPPPLAGSKGDLRYKPTSGTVMSYWSSGIVTNSCTKKRDRKLSSKWAVNKERTCFVPLRARWQFVHVR